MFTGFSGVESSPHADEHLHEQNESSADTCAKSCAESSPAPSDQGCVEPSTASSVPTSEANHDSAPSNAPRSMIIEDVPEDILVDESSCNVENMLLADYFDEFDTRPFCEMFDELFSMDKYQPCTFAEKTLLKKLLKEEEGIDDDGFIKDLLFVFTNGLSVQDVRRIAHNSDFFSNSLNIITAFQKLKDVYTKIQPVIISGHCPWNDDQSIIVQLHHISHFLHFVLFEPIEFLRDCLSDIHDCWFFPTKRLIKDFIKISSHKLHDGKTPCILSFICSNTTVVHELFSKRFAMVIPDKYIPDMDADGNDYFDNLVTRIEQRMGENEK